MIQNRITAKAPQTTAGSSMIGICSMSMNRQPGVVKMTATLDALAPIPDAVNKSGIATTGGVNTGASNVVEVSC